MKRGALLLLLLAVLLSVAPVAARQGAAPGERPAAVLPDARLETAKRLAEPVRSEPAWLPPAWFVKAPPPLVLRQPAAPALFGDWSNGAALGCITPLALASSYAFGYGLTAPPPLDFNAAMAEYAANLGLKFCAPVVVPPDDLPPIVPELYGENPPPADDPYRCGYTFSQPTLDGQYRNFMGIPIPWADVFPGRSWGDFGAPFVLHHNSAVNLSVSAAQGERLGGGAYYLPIGQHKLTWRGETQMSPLDLIPVYVPGWAWSRVSKLDGLANEAAETTTELVISLGFLEATFVPSWTTMVNDEYQEVVILDLEDPVVDGPRELAVEAIEPGGISRRTLLAQLQRTLTVTDDCDSQPKLFAANQLNLPEFFPADAQQKHYVFWVAEDDGPSSSSHGPNQSAPYRQEVTVQDTKPPIILTPPDIVTETATLPAPVALGHPATFDLADLDPTVSHDACSRPGVVCNHGEMRFPAGQTTVTWTARDASGNQSSASQLVNVKSLGSNRAPTANGGSESAVSFEPITLTLRANDPDGDRLWFRVDEQPENGFFRAPLYPYFIQDYRLANVAGIDFDDYCSQEEHRSDYLPVSWPVDARFMTVDDEGNIYVQDQGIIRCNGFDDGWNSHYRLAIFRPDGTWEESGSDSDVKDIQVDVGNDILYTARHGVGGANPKVNVYDLDLNHLASYRTDYTEPFIREPKSVAIDVERNLLYLSNGSLTIGTSHLVLMRFDPDAPPSDNDPEGVAEYEGFGDGSHVWLDLALDSQGNLYASEREGDRIYKWGAPTVNDDGTVTPGELIGWMGRCDDGPGCDKQNGRSFGYACSDTTCTVSETSGDRPGQFDSPRGIAIGPNDILYVTDYWNFRVQRFTPDGYFAGQAISECDGSCFVLGDFGAPHQVTVNSNHFYVLDRGDDLLHVFETTPVTRITENSAEIVYQSDNNFVGADAFTFSAADGLDRSPPATVTVDVSRNFRPPTAIGPLTATTAEDASVALPVAGFDPDGTLDTLTYVAVDPPRFGAFSRQGDDYVYTPDPDFAGSDSFTFAASDGRFLSEPQTISVTVTPVNDPPRFPDPDDPNRPLGFALHPAAAGYAGFDRLASLGTADDPLRTGRGFNTVFSISFEDPDNSDVNMVRIDWGDGSPIEMEGKLLEDGTLTGPVLSEGVTGGPGTVTAEHIFDTAGDYTVEICISDNAAVDGDGNKSLTAGSTTTCQPLSVTVAPMVDLLVEIRPSANPYADGSSLSYDIVVSNHAPESGNGLTATGIEVTETLDSRLRPGTISAPGGSCSTGGHVVTCALDLLAPGESTTIHVPVQVPGAIKPGDVLANHVAFVVDQENQGTVPANGDLVTVVAPADFVVNTVVDDGDASPGDGACATEAGACSLRAAVEEANERPGTTTIATADWQVLLKQELVVSTDLTIRGLGAGQTVIGRSEPSRLFRVEVGGSLALQALTLQGGASDGDGGALYNEGATTLRAVQVSGNQAAGDGGALWNSGTLLLIDSSVTGNRAEGSGGGIANDGTLTMRNVTLSGNSAFSGGGLSSGTDATLQNVTVAYNDASEEGGGVIAGGDFRIRNTILAQNAAGWGSPDCSGAITSRDHNLLGNGDGCEVTGPQTGDVVGRKPHLAPLALGAGNTFSHPLLGGSPAIDGGSCLLAADQHGVARPVDGDLDRVPACDIGAVEFAPRRLLLPAIYRK